MHTHLASRRCPCHHAHSPCLLAQPRSLSHPAQTHAEPAGSSRPGTLMVRSLHFRLQVRRARRRGCASPLTSRPWPLSNARLLCRPPPLRLPAAELRRCDWCGHRAQRVRKDARHGESWPRVQCCRQICARTWRSCRWRFFVCVCARARRLHKIPFFYSFPPPYSCSLQARRLLVDWICEVGEDYRLNSTTMHMAVRSITRTRNHCTHGSMFSHCPVR